MGTSLLKNYLSVNAKTETETNIWALLKMTHRHIIGSQWLYLHYQLNQGHYIGKNISITIVKFGKTLVSFNVPTNILPMSIDAHALVTV